MRMADLPGNVEVHAGAPGSRLDVIVIHETNGRKYLEALVRLHEMGQVRSLKFVEASVCWKFLFSLLRERKPLRRAIAEALRNLRFRLTFVKVRSSVIVLCVPPWDYRFLLYAALRHRNVLIYNTSWPYWEGTQVPRRWGFLTPLFRNPWMRVLSESRVNIVAVTAAAARSLAGAIPSKRAIIISHAVSDAHFVHRAKHRVPFRILFVGDLVERRGLHKVREIINGLQGEPVELDIVGDGKLRGFAAKLATSCGGTFHGRISDRSQLARIMASCQVLISPSVKTNRWEELFGMSIIEAMACGLPCIASDHIGPRALIESGVSGVTLPENSPAEMTAWVKTLLRDENEWNRMSAAAVQAARSFALDAVTERWRRVLVEASKQLSVT